MTQASQEMVVYSDGSSKPNPGFIGFGLHGYTYTNDVPKKNYGGKGYRLTSFGYAVKDKEQENNPPSVTPIKIFDGFGAYPDTATNNTAEVIGIKEALKLGLEQPINKLLIKTDSEYARKGYMQWLDRWASNQWLNREGRFIANVSTWQDVYELKQKYHDKQIEVCVEWVKGHVGLPGNEKADKLANIGRVNSETNNHGVQIHTHTGEEYWSRNMATDKHPLLSKPWMYMRGSVSSHVPGEYYFGNIGKDEDFIGKRDANGGYAIIQLKNSNAALDLIRGIQTKRSGDNSNVYVVNMRALYSGERLSELLEFGESVLIKANPRLQDLYFIDSAMAMQKNEEQRREYSEDDFGGDAEEDPSADNDEEAENSKSEPLTREQRPQKLSARVFDCLASMKEKLEDFKQGNNRFNQYYDITGEFYTIETKMVKKEAVTQHKLKPEFKVGTMLHDFKITYEGQELPIKLNLTIDAPDRNCLKRLETLNPKLTLIVWKESEIAVRYALVVQCDDADSIWSGFYSNLIFLPAKGNK